MANVVSSLTSALPNCILHRVMGLASPLEVRTLGDTRPMTLLRVQLGRADMRDDTTLAINITCITLLIAIDFVDQSFHMVSSHNSHDRTFCNPVGQVQNKRVYFSFGKVHLHLTENTFNLLFYVNNSNIILTSG